MRDRLRSVSLAKLTALGQIDGIELYSLQKSATATEEIAASGLDLIDLGPELTDFRDTAAAISQLDLIISVDTAVAHLAGALGKPVWTLVADPPDWRWLLHGERTPWYPTMLLFRQRKRNQWDPVVERPGTDATAMGRFGRSQGDATNVRGRRQRRGRRYGRSGSAT